MFLKKYRWTTFFGVIVFISIILIIKFGKIVTGPEVFIPGYKPGVKLEEIEDPDVKAFLKVSELFGDRSLLMVILHSPEGFFTHETTKDLKEISKELKNLEEIKSVLSVLDLPKSLGFRITTYGEDDVLSKDVLKDKNAESFISKDGKYTVILCFLKSKVKPITVVKGVREVLEPYEKYSPLLFGEPVIDETLFKELQAQNYVYPPIIFGLIFIIFLIQTRSVVASLLSVIIPIQASLMVFAVLFLLGHPLNTMTAMAPSYLLIIGAAYGLHFYNGLCEGSNVGDAMKKKKLPIIFSMLTTIAGMISFVFIDIVAFKEFGLIVSTGLALTTLMIFLIIPEIVKTAKKKPKSLGIRYFGDGVAKIFIVISILIVVSFPFLANRIKIGSTGIEYFRESSEVMKAFNVLKEHFGYRDTVYVILEKERPFTAQDNEEVKKLMSEIEKVRGVSSAIFPVEIPLPIAKLLVKNQVFLGTFIRNDAIRIMVQLNEKGVEEFERVKNDIQDILQKYRKRYKITLSGVLVLWNRVNKEILESQIKSIVFAFMLIFGMVSVLFRSIRKTIIAVVPIVVTAVLNFVLMALFSIRLEIGTSIVAGMLMGLIIDYSIHIAHEMKGSTPEEAVKIVGPAIMANAFGLSAGFSVLIFSTLKLYMNISILMVIGILYGALVTITMEAYFFKKTPKKMTVHFDFTAF